jgi:hypothetical protein
MINTILALVILCITAGGQNWDVESALRNATASETAAIISQLKTTATQVTAMATPSPTHSAFPVNTDGCSRADTFLVIHFIPCMEKEEAFREC